MLLCEHPHFNKAVLLEVEYFRDRGLRQPSSKRTRSAARKVRNRFGPARILRKSCVAWYNRVSLVGIGCYVISQLLTIRQFAPKRTVPRGMPFRAFESGPERV